MRKIEFNVPLKAMTEFVNEMTCRNLNNTVSGTTEDGEIIIEIEYEKDESDDIDELEEIFQELLDQIEEENE